MIDELIESLVDLLAARKERDASVAHRRKAAQGGYYEPDIDLETRLQNEKDEFKAYLSAIIDEQIEANVCRRQH